MSLLYQNTTTPWLDTGDNAWQLTAASLVGLQSVPGLVVLYVFARVMSEIITDILFSVQQLRWYHA